MAGESALNGNFRCFQITNFSHHGNIWILAQNRTQAFGKSIIFTRIDLALIHPFHFVFYWIFQSYNFNARFI